MEISVEDMNFYPVVFVQRNRQTKSDAYISSLCKLHKWAQNDDNDKRVIIYGVIAGAVSARSMIKAVRSMLDDHCNVTIILCLL